MASPANLSLAEWSHPDYPVLRGQVPAVSLWRVHSAPAPVVTFCYVDGNLGKPAGFDTHLLEYRELFGRLESVQVVYVSTDQRTFTKAERIFRHLCGTLAAKSARVPSDPDLDRLRGRVRARVLLEGARPRVSTNSSLTDCGMSCGSCEAPNTRNFIKIWREHGDGAALCGMEGLSTGLARLARIGSTTTTGSSVHFPGGPA